MSSQPPESGDLEPRPETEAKQAAREANEAAQPVTPAKPPWWKFWAKR
jgi:hypothetical protein